MDEEESIDLEALQAQIDLSMSFAQDMVSSWVKPSRQLSNRKVGSEAELTEYMRRPPRLGVGAPVPKAVSLSREVARLKGQLSEKNNKRPRDEGGARATKQGSGDDDEESRSTVIKKKVKTDPFGGIGKVKPPRIERKPSENKIAMIHTREESQPTEVLRMTKDSTPVPTIIAQPKLTSEPHTASRGDHGYTSTVDAPPMTLEQHNGISHVSPTTNSASARRLAQTAELLRQPLLNLAPLPSDDDSAGDGKVGRSLTSPTKKKRKRRKKKKTCFVESTTASTTTI